MSIIIEIKRIFIAIIYLLSTGSIACCMIKDSQSPLITPYAGINNKILLSPLRESKDYEIRYSAYKTEWDNLSLMEVTHYIFGNGSCDGVVQCFCNLFKMRQCHISGCERAPHTAVGRIVLYNHSGNYYAEIPIKHIFLSGYEAESALERSINALKILEGKSNSARKRALSHVQDFLSSPKTKDGRILSTPTVERCYAFNECLVSPSKYINKMENYLNYTTKPEYREIFVASQDVGLDKKGACFYCHSEREILCYACSIIEVLPDDHIQQCGSIGLEIKIAHSVGPCVFYQ